MEPLEAINEALTELDSGIDVYETAILANASALEESGKKTLKGAPDKRTSEYKGAQRQRGGVAEAQEARAAAAADTAMRDQGGAFGQLGKSAGKIILKQQKPILKLSTRVEHIPRLYLERKNN